MPRGKGAGGWGLGGGRQRERDFAWCDQCTMQCADVLLSCILETCIGL